MDKIKRLTSSIFAIVSGFSSLITSIILIDAYEVFWLAYVGAACLFLTIPLLTFSIMLIVKIRKIEFFKAFSKLPAILLLVIALIQLAGALLGMNLVNDSINTAFISSSSLFLIFSAIELFIANSDRQYDLIKTKIEILDKLYAKGILNKDEYDAKRNNIINKL